MKHIRLQLILLICSCLVLLPCAPVNVQAQDKAEDGKKVFDNYSTVVGMVYPAGGAMFKASSCCTNRSAGRPASGPGRNRGRSAPARFRE